MPRQARVSAQQLVPLAATMQGPCGAAPLGTPSESVRQSAALLCCICDGYQLRQGVPVEYEKTYVCEHGPPRSAWSPQHQGVCCCAAAAVALLPCSVRVHACVRPHFVFCLYNQNAKRTCPGPDTARRTRTSNLLDLMLPRYCCVFFCCCVCICCWVTCVSNFLMPLNALTAVPNSKSNPSCASLSAV